MKGDVIPPEDHVLRHCGKFDLKWEPSGEIRGVFPHAFEHDEEGISVTWVEYFAGCAAEQLVAARAAIARARRLRSSHRLAKLNVGDVLEAGNATGVATRVVHDPDPGPPENANPAHSLIRGEWADPSDFRNRLANLVLALESAM